MMSIGIYHADGTLTPVNTAITRALDSTTGADTVFTAAADFLGANLCRLFEDGAP